jgi:hypothetical protein
MATETPAQMAARFRKMAQDPKLPQSVKNTYLDKANEVEKAAAKPTMNKGGAMLPVRGSRTAKHKETKMAKGGMVKKDFKPCEGCPTPAKCKAAGKCMAKEGKGGKPAFAVMIAVGKPAAKKGK